MTSFPSTNVQLNNRIDNDYELKIQTRLKPSVQGLVLHVLMSCKHQKVSIHLPVKATGSPLIIYASMKINNHIQEMAESTKHKSTVKTELDEWGRKKFTIQEKSQSEEQQQPVIAESNGHKSLLVGREQNLNIEKYVGRIEKGKKNKKREVFFCEVCNEGFKCDLAYITHLNSPQHNRKLGMSMKVKAVSAESVVEKLNNMKKKTHLLPEEREMAKFLETAFVKKENKYMKKDEQEQNEDEVLKQDEDKGEEEEEEEQDDVEAEMRALGLPTAFGSKKNKR